MKNYSGNDCWEIERIESQELPEELLLDLLGNRKNVLFVEGTTGSYDTQLYSLIYKDYYVIPCGSCTQVIIRTKAFNNTELLHHYKAYGLIDRDYRSDYEIEALKSNNIFTIGVAEVENLFLLTKDELKVDVCEFGIEAVFNNSQLPIAAFFKPLLKYGFGIHERKLVRNTLYFLVGFQSGNIDKDRLSEYKQKLQNDYSYFEEETTRIVMILESIVESMRAKIIGCLYMNMINGRITHAEFCEYSDLTNRLYISELEYLSKKSDEIPQHTFNRMIGLVILTSGMRFGAENMDSHIVVSDNTKWTRFGKKYMEIISGLV